jgi:hypothetical protein
MIPEAALTEDEIANLREGIKNLMIDLEKKGIEQREFYSNPTFFLRKYKIKVMDYIHRAGGLAGRLSRSIREVIRLMKNIINPCFGCKLAVLVIMIATLGKIQYYWDLLFQVADNILESLRKYFDKTSQEIERLFNGADEYFRQYRPAELALLICKDLGFCP